MKPLPDKQEPAVLIQPSRNKTALGASKRNTRSNSQIAIGKNTMLQVSNVKRPASSPKTKDEPSKKKRSAIGDITNAMHQPSLNGKKVKKEKRGSQLQALNKKNKLKSTKPAKENIGKENPGFICFPNESKLSTGSEELSGDSLELLLVGDDFSKIMVDGLESSCTSSSTNYTTTSSEETSEISQETRTSEERSDQPNSGIVKPDDVRDVDTDIDPCNVCEYAESVFRNMKANEAEYQIKKYLDTGSAVTPHMRAILIDWLVEVQENFELYHETLYLAAKIVDLYLQQNICKKDKLQLVGATALFISCKIEERYAPPLDDFVYICDDVYNGDQFRKMEREILRALDFKLGAPSSYRFLRRYGRVAGVSMEVLTLARFILESSLTEYDFVDATPSMISAAALNLALKMKNAGEWDSTLKYHSSYSDDELKPLVSRLNNMLKANPKANVTNVRKKYSHPVFYEVAKTEPLIDV